MSSTRSDALVFFGASGDLAYKMISPALQAMERRGHLDVPVIGIAKSGWTTEQLRSRAHDSLAEHGAVDEPTFDKLAARLVYLDGDYGDPATYRKLRETLGAAAHPVRYLAIPPELFFKVIEGLGQSGSARGTRGVVEKPFGRDLASARVLNQTLGKVFDEADVFRIDHYLGKEPVQNLMVFRFENTFLEPVWNRNYVEKVEISMAESFGVQGRGGLYDEVGTIRDVIQNHLLQVVGFLAMELPVASDHDAIRDELVRVLRTFRPLDPADVVRGQFRGYLKEKGVAARSTTETYAAVRLHLGSQRWEGIPFFVRAGKCLPTTKAEVVVQLKRPPVSKLKAAEANCLRFRFRLSPEVSIHLDARVKRPGEEMIGEPAELAVARHPGGDEMLPYERLLGDAMVGDATLIAREEGVEEAWSVVDPVLGDDPPIHLYEPGTGGPAEAAKLTAALGGWRESP